MERKGRHPFSLIWHLWNMGIFKMQTPSKLRECLNFSIRNNVWFAEITELHHSLKRTPHVGSHCQLLLPGAAWTEQDCEGTPLFLVALSCLLDCHAKEIPGDRCSLWFNSTAGQAVGYLHHECLFCQKKNYKWTSNKNTSLQYRINPDPILPGSQ